jgi:hypothetical protein
MIERNSIGGLTAALTLVPIAPDALYGTLICALIFGIMCGLIGGLGTGSLGHIASVETISWNWNHFCKRAVPGLIFGLFAGLAPCLLLLIVKISSLNTLNIHLFLIYLVFCLVIGGVFCGFTSGLIGGFTDTVRAAKASQNEGIKLSAKNSLAIFLVTWLTIAVLAGVIGGA